MSQFAISAALHQRLTVFSRPEFKTNIVMNPDHWIHLTGLEIIWKPFSWNDTLKIPPFTRYILELFSWVIRGSTMFRSGISWINNAKTRLFCESSFSCPSKINSKFMIYHDEYIVESLSTTAKQMYYIFIQIF